MIRENAGYSARRSIHCLDLDQKFLSTTAAKSIGVDGQASLTYPTPQTLEGLL